MRPHNGSERSSSSLGRSSVLCSLSAELLSSLLSEGDDSLETLHLIVGPPAAVVVLLCAALAWGPARAARRHKMRTPVDRFPTPVL